MPLDGISCHYLAGELNDRLGGARVDKIQQPHRFDLLLTLRAGGRGEQLMLSANPSGPALYLTNAKPEMPKTASGFTMLLRKHLQGARLDAIETEGFERVFSFRFTSLDELGDETQLTLVLEIMGRHSNLILLNRDGRILDAVNHVDHEMSRVREVMPARVYQPVPPQDKLSPEDALARLDDGSLLPGPSTADPQGQAVKQPVVRTVLMDLLQGFSPQLVDEAVIEAGLEPKQRYATLAADDRARLKASLRSILTAIRDERYAPSLFARDEQGRYLTDFHCLPLKHQGYRKPASSLSAAMDTYYEQLHTRQQFAQAKQSLERVVRRQHERSARKYNIHLDDRRSSADYETVRQMGDILTANLYRVTQGMDELEADNWYDPEGGRVTIKLNEHRSPAWNSQRYFKQYNKLKSRYEASARLLVTDEQELAYLDSLANAIGHAETLADLRVIRDEMIAQGLLAGKRDKEKEAASGREQLNPGKPMSGFRARKQQRILQSRQQKARAKKKREKGDGSEPLPPRRYRSSDNLTILVGRNNVQNDKLTLRTANKDDLWLHVQKAPGTHVIVRAEGREIPERTILEAAETAAWFSRGNRAQRDVAGSAGKVPVDYCPAGHVRKPAGARPGMVIYDGYSTVLVEAVDPARFEAATPGDGQAE